jgi:murein DD-endopeptidase MepM/ murein hydrolase activator NlpD
MATTKPDASPIDEDHPNVDPTANVLQLVEAANLRQDDLRKADSRRLEDLRIAETKRLDEVSELRATHIKELNAAEAKRIDAIRAVDVAAVATASERASQQASVLANQVSISAETLRTLVASTATAQAQSQAQFSSQINERLALLEKSQYKGEGRSGLSEPVMAELITEVKSLRAVGERTVGKSAGINWVGTVTGGIVTMLVGLLALGGWLLALLGRAPL